MSITVNFVKDGKVVGTVQTTLAAHGQISDLLAFAFDSFTVGEAERAKYCLVSTKFGFAINQLSTMEKLLTHLGKEDSVSPCRLTGQIRA